ncbi:MAG: hypothetical protein J0L76_17295 [Rhodobacterales bacterium]|nr:hypothetical protein [Rhodobacterales bacterium]
MRRTILASSAALVLGVPAWTQDDDSLAGPELSQPYSSASLEEAAWDWKPGDLVFRNDLNRFDDLLREAEGGQWASVAVLRPSSGGPVAIFVDEQIGVTETPLDAFIDGGPYAVFRVRGIEEHRSEEYHAGPMALFAGITALEVPYDHEMMYENQKFYNAELAFASALNAGVILGSPKPLRDLTTHDAPLGQALLERWREHSFCIEAMDELMCWEWVRNLSVVTARSMLASDALEQVYP